MTRAKRTRQNFFRDNNIDRSWFDSKPSFLREVEYDFFCDFYGVRGSYLSLYELESKYRLSKRRVYDFRQKIVKKIILEQKYLRTELSINRILLAEYSDRKSVLSRFIEIGVELACCLYAEVAYWFDPENILIEDMGFSTRAYNVLARNGLFTLQKIYDYEECKGLISLLNMGDLTYQEILSKINLKNFHRVSDSSS